MIFLDINRAKQIIHSPEKIQVLYQGRPVWINAIQTDQHADIQFMDSQERSQVSINKLVEA